MYQYQFYFMLFFYYYYCHYAKPVPILGRFWVPTVIDTALITLLCIALSHWFKATLFSTLSFHSNIVDLRIAAQLGSLWDSVTQTYILRTAGPTLATPPLWLQPQDTKHLFVASCECFLHVEFKVCMSRERVAHDSLGWGVTMRLSNKLTLWPTYCVWKYPDPVVYMYG